MLLVNKRMQHGAKAFRRNSPDFRLEPDTEKRNRPGSPELKRAFAEERSLLRWFNGLNYSTRKALIDLIAQVKSAEARARRADQVAEQLLATRAERELPPILQVAFARNSRAREGWERMSPGRRRGHLLGIFYQRSSDLRARRELRKPFKTLSSIRRRPAKESADRGRSKGRLVHPFPPDTGERTPQPWRPRRPRGCAPLHRSVANVAGREHSRNAGLEVIRSAIERPVRGLLLANQVGTGNQVSGLIAHDPGFVGPARVRFAADACEQPVGF